MTEFDWLGDRRLDSSGCNFHDDCLTCPLPKCVLEMTPTDRKYLRRGTSPREESLRTQAMVQELVNMGTKFGQAYEVVGKNMGVTRRTV